MRLHRCVVGRQIVDEDGFAGLEFVEQLLHRRTLAALVADHAIGHAQPRQLQRAALGVMIGDVGEHHHVAILGELPQRVGGADDRMLVVHPVRKEAIQQRREFLGFHRTAVGALHIAGQGKAVHAQRQAVDLAQIINKRRDEVQQHAITIGNDERTRFHQSLPSLRAARASASGFTPMASAVATRSCSLAIR